MKNKIKTYLFNKHNVAFKHINNTHLNKATMLHFDSHPDLMTLEGVYPSDKTKLYDQTNIASWITPLVYEKKISTVILVLPPWGGTISPGVYNLVLGLDENGILTVKGNNLPNYFKDTVNYNKPLKQSIKWKLIVLQYDKNYKLNEKVIINELNKSNEWILDIDEDFFSCINPYRKTIVDNFGIENWKIYKNIGKPEWHKYLHIFQNFLHNFDSFDQNIAIIQNIIPSLAKDANITQKKTISIIEKFLHFIKNIDKDIVDVINIRRLLSYVRYGPLPHYINKLKGVIQSGKAMNRLLRKINSNPKIITIARSLDAGFTPKSQWNEIETTVLSLLQKIYKIDIWKTR